MLARIAQRLNRSSRAVPGERLEEEVAGLFPGTRVLVLSSDLVATIERMREELKAVADGHVDIVTGTQVVAKGHHFPKLNLVGVVDADLGLPTAIRALPNAPSSSCIRSRGAPGGPQAKAAASSRRISPTIR
jgi:hypothetical protein